MNFCTRSGCQDLEKKEKKKRSNFKGLSCSRTIRGPNHHFFSFLSAHIVRESIDALRKMWRINGQDRETAGRRSRGLRPSRSFLFLSSFFLYARTFPCTYIVRAIKEEGKGKGACAQSTVYGHQSLFSFLLFKWWPTCGL